MAQQIQQTQSLESGMEDSVSKFTVELYRILSKTNDGNMFMSPYSVSAALMLTMLGTGGSSEAQLKSVLNLPDIPANNLHESYKNMHDMLTAKSGKNVQLSIANRVFARLGLEINDSYKEDSSRFYDSELEMLDFIGNPEGSRLRINTWVEDKTNKKIKDLIPAGGINSMSLVVLTNAIYFKGDWALQFKPENTKKEPFMITETEKKDVEMMHIKDEDNFLSAQVDKFDCKVLVLPYKGNTLSMVVVLPNKTEGLPELENQLSIGALREIEACAYRQETIVGLPQFKLETSYKLEEVLPTMGLTDIFSPQTADFSAMLKNVGEKVFVSDVIHKAFVEVNEEGTEAAAATAVMVRLMCLGPPPLEFRADHPFLFYIKENSRNTITFIGRYTQPPE